MILAFDTATAATVAAVGDDDGTPIAVRRHDPAAGERPGHGSRLLALATEALAEAGSGWSEITRIGAGVGPGGFTGLRIGLASARALALTLAVETVPLGSLAAIAKAAIARQASAMSGPFVAVLDARRGEVFAAVCDGDGRCSQAYALAPERLATELSLPPRWHAAGDGAIRYYEQLIAQGGQIAPNCDRGHRIDPAALLGITATGLPAPLNPVYVRSVDAVPQR